MRLHFKIKTSRKALPFDHLPLLTGTIHKWLGQNNEHGDVSLYSFSQLEGGNASPKYAHLGDLGFWLPIEPYWN